MLFLIPYPYFHLLSKIENPTWVGLSKNTCLCLTLTYNGIRIDYGKALYKGKPARDSRLSHEAWIPHGFWDRLPSSQQYWRTWCLLFGSRPRLSFLKRKYRELGELVSMLRELMTILGELMTMFTSSRVKWGCLTYQRWCCRDPSTSACQLGSCSTFFAVHST